MKKLLVLVVLAFAAWQAWKHYPELTQHTPSNEAVVKNQSGHGIERLRLSVGGQTFVKEVLANGESTTFPFRVNNDASFQMTWNWADAVPELSWSGGSVSKGPMVQRHQLTITPGGGVMVEATEIPQPAK